MDASRSMVIYDSMNTMLEGVKQFSIDHTNNEIQVLRVKERFSEPMAGWSDILINARFVNADYSSLLFVWEVQLVHKSMLMLRHDFGGHDVHDRFRFAKEVLENANRQHYQPISKPVHLDV